MKHKGKRKRVPTKLKMRLQKEINSICPFCPCEEVSIFQAHHIDENPENTVFENLILLCPNCHQKINGGEISKEEVIKMKILLLDGVISNLELVSINIDSANCSWINEEKEHYFSKIASTKSPFPILDFTFINHFKKTIALKALRIKIEHLYSGLSGPISPSVVKPLTKYVIPLQGKEVYYRVPDPIQVPADNTFRFLTELIEKPAEDDQVIYSLDGRKILHFSFEFSGDIKCDIPPIFLNIPENKNNTRLVFTD